MHKSMPVAVAFGNAHHTRAGDPADVAATSYLTNSFTRQRSILFDFAWQFTPYLEQTEIVRAGE